MRIITQAAQGTAHSLAILMPSQVCVSKVWRSIRISIHHSCGHAISPLSCVSIFTSPEHMSLFVCVSRKCMDRLLCCAEGSSKAQTCRRRSGVSLSLDDLRIFCPVLHTVLCYSTVEIWASRGTLAPFPALRGKRHVNHSRECPGLKLLGGQELLAPRVLS